MKVLITGGTGYIGSHTAAAAMRAGHDVRLLVRNESRVAAALSPLGADPRAPELVVGDVTDPDSVARAVKGVDAVVHLATVFSMDSRDARRMRRTSVPGVRTVLDEAVRAGADPVVYVSSYAALMPTRRPLTTDLPIGTTRWSSPPYFVAQVEAETHARALQEQGAPVTVVYGLATLGPHDPHMGDQLTRLRNAVLGRLKFLPVGGFSVSDVRDLAELLTAALSAGHGPRRIIPPGHHVSTREYMAAVAAVTGRKRRVLYTPANGSLVACWCMDRIQHVVPWHLPTEYTAAYICYCDARIDGSMPNAPLGVSARPLSDTIGDSIRWLHDNGHLSARHAGFALQPPAPVEVGALED